MGILVVDVGTSSVRAAVVSDGGKVEHVHRRPLPPNIPMPGLVEFDPEAMASAALEVATAARNDVGGRVDAVGICAQRSSAVVWDGSTGRPLGPGLGWQDLRTAGTCLELQAKGFSFSPSESATKFAWLLDQIEPSVRDDARLGTVDSWIAWNLTRGERHVTDLSQCRGDRAAATATAAGGDDDAIDALGLSRPRLPTHRRFSGTSRRGPGPARGTAAVRHRRRSAGVAHRPGVHQRRPGQGDLRHRGHARHVSRWCPTRVFPAEARAAAFPIVAWRIGGEHHLGGRGHHAGRR